MKILVVDDESGILEPLKEFLAKKGHAVDTCSNGREALEFLGREEYDIAFLDFSMPEVTGLELVERLKKRGARTKTVIFTAYPLMEDFFIHTMGADKYLSKPFRFEEVETILHQVADENGKRQRT